MRWIDEGQTKIQSLDELEICVAEFKDVDLEVI